MGGEWLTREPGSKLNTTTKGAPMSETPPTNIHEALSRAKVLVGVIGKDDENKQQGYAFRGIDAIVNKVGPVFSDLGIVIAPVHRLISSESVVAGSGTKGYRVVIESTWTFSIHVDRLVDHDAPAANEVAKGRGVLFPETSAITVQTLGESIDYSDKAINQAQTQSFKNALAQVLTIPTGEPDPDSETPEHVEPKTSGQKILDGLTKEGFNVTKARKYAAEAMKVLELRNPIPDEQVAEVVTTAIKLRNEAESPMAKPDEDDTGEGYGS